jgi:hypothetical protein
MLIPPGDLVTRFYNYTKLYLIEKPLKYIFTVISYIVYIGCCGASDVDDEIERLRIIWKNKQTDKSSRIN